MTDIVPDIELQFDPKAMARVLKRLDQWQGAPLAKRTEKAIQAGASLMVAPIRTGARRHHVTGETERTVRVRKLRNRPAEIVAYKVGVTTWYGHFPITGVYGGPNDPYVDAAYNSLNGQVRSFIDAQITRLA